jgi:hypothetical protein
MVAICCAGCDDYYVPITATNTGTSTGGATGIVVTLSPGGIVFVDVAKSRLIAATLTSDTGNQGVNWTLTGPGTLTNVTPNQVVYNAPTTQDLPATVTATSVADPTQVASSTMYSVPPPTFSTTALVGGSVGAAYSQNVGISNGAAPYSWSVASGSLPPGINFYVSSLTTITLEGAPTAAGSYSFTLQVTDVCTVVAKQAFTLTIGAASMASSAATLGGGGVKNALVQGNYVFEFGGFGPNGTVGAAGSFTADGNGNVSGGVVDRVSAVGAQKALAFTGTYAVGANQLGEMALTFADGTSATYAVAVSSNGDARFIEFDDTTGTGTNGSGQMRKQDATSLAAMKVSGNYAFELAGVDAQGLRMAVTGEFSANDAGAVSEGALDANDAGTMTSQPTLAGSYTPAVNGVGSAALSLTGAGAAHLNLYAISADEFFAVETDGAGQPLLVGSIMRQSGGPYTNATLAGSDVLRMTGTSGGATSLVFGLLSADKAGNAALSAALVTSEGVSEMDANYTASVSASGRAVMSTASGAPIVYLVGLNEGFVLGTDASVMTGWVGPQATGAMTNASFSGTFAGASMISAGSGVTESIVALSFDGKGNVSGTGASSGPNGLMLLPVQMGTYSVSSGDLFLSVTWPMQNPQTMVIAPAGTLIVVPVDASFVPILISQ